MAGGCMLALVGLSCWLSVCHTQAPESLQLVVGVFRHGDRTAINLMPNDEIKEVDWKEGLGQLTQKGIKQQYENGKFLRRRYLGFLNKTYHHNEIYVRSTNFDRTLMSAQAMLAGLYTPEPEQSWSALINWMPIPVHTVAKCDDPLLNVGSTDPTKQQHLCPLAGNISPFKDTAGKNYEKKYKDILAKIDADAGYNGTADVARVVWSTYDTLLCEKNYGFALPAWAVEDNLMEVLENTLVPELMGIVFNHSDIRNYQNGKLLHTIAEGFRLKKNSSKDSLYAGGLKTYFYSAHDSTILGLLSSLGLYNSTIIPYNAMVIFELHHDDESGWFVQIYYKNVIESDTTTRLILPGCMDNCPLTYFLNFADQYSETNWKIKCLKPRIFELKNLKQFLGVGLSIGMGILAVALVLSWCVARRCSRRRSRIRQYGRIRELSRPEEVPMMSSNSIGSDGEE